MTSRQVDTKRRAIRGATEGRPEIAEVVAPSDRSASAVVDGTVAGLGTPVAGGPKSRGSIGACWSLSCGSSSVGGSSRGTGRMLIAGRGGRRSTVAGRTVSVAVMGASRRTLRLPLFASVSVLQVERYEAQGWFHEVGPGRADEAQRSAGRDRESERPVPGRTVRV